MARKRILFVSLDYPEWKDASHWGYPSNMGMEQGFLANDVDLFILPATHRYGEKRRFWVDFARQLIGTQTYDQVWLEIVHSNIDDDLLEFLVSRAPIRLGLSFESLELLPEEWKNNPEACAIRQEVLTKRLSVLTHLLTTDETDAKRFESSKLNAQPIIPGFSIPREFIVAPTTPPGVPFGVFFGSLYGERRQWLEMPLLQSVLRYSNASPEVHTPLPRAFDELHERANQLFQLNGVDLEALNTYLQGVRIVRKECFKLWLDGLRIGAAVVNLPQWGRAYAGRVVEGMAAGRPVITREMPDRPIAKAAFEDGKEILLYRTPEELHAHLERVIRDPAYAERIASAARAKLLDRYTSEGYFRTLLDWLER